MTVLPAWFALTCALAVMASLAIWARGATRARGLAVVGFLVASPISAAALLSALGWPIPYIPGITISSGKHKVLGGKIVENVAIYVLFDGSLPRYYQMPFDMKTAQEMQEAMAAGRKGDGTGATVPPFDYTLDPLPPMFWPEPQQKMPEKRVVATPPMFSP